MSVIQVVSSYSGIRIKNPYQIHGLPSLPCVSVSRLHRLPTATFKLTSDRQCCRPSSPVCLFGGSGKSADGNQNNPWKAIENNIKNIGKKPSVEDLLRKQINKEEYFDGGRGGSPPGGSGGGGGGFGGTEDEDEDGVLDETIQVTLATMGLIFVYLYIINGGEILLLARDIIKFVFSGNQSIRLAEFLYVWERFFKHVTKKKQVVEEPYWLERAIISTPTWWDSPEKYKRMARASLEARYSKQM